MRWILYSENEEKIMISKVSSSIVGNILSIYFNRQIELKDLVYFCDEHDDIAVYSFAKMDLLEIGISKIYSIGVPILEKRNEVITLLPGILKVVSNLHKIKIAYKQSIDVSHNKSIPLKATDDLYLLCDHLARIVSLGEINKNIYVPLVDLGYYLRSEN